MKKTIGIALAAMAMIGFASAAMAADASKYEGKWSTWGCHVNWFDLGKSKITIFGTEGGVASPSTVTFSLPAKMNMENGKLSVAYNYRGSKRDFMYDPRGNDTLMLDKELVDGNVVFDRMHSNSPYKDKPTERCAPSA
jgi:hypothetical protein